MATNKDGERLKLPELAKWRNGVITGAYYYYSDKWKKSEVKLVGDWEGEGHGYWFAPWGAVEQLAKAGVLRQKDNLERFEVVNTSQRVGLYRVQEGKRHVWQAFALDAGGNAVTLPGTTVTDPHPKDGNGGSDPGPPGPAGAQSGPGPAPGASTAAGPGAPPQQQTVHGETADEIADRNRAALIQLSEQYETAHALSCRGQVRNLRRPTREIADEALHAGTATLLISMRELGIRVQPGMAAGARQKLHEAEDEILEARRQEES